MPLKLNKPVQLNTGFKIPEIKLCDTVEIVSVVLRMTEGTAVVDYRIVSQDKTRDHRNAITVPLASVTGIKKVLKDLYGEVAKQPNMEGTISDD